MKKLSQEEVYLVSAGLSDPQLTYLIASAFQTLITVGIKLSSNNLDRNFLSQNVGFPILSVATLGIGYEMANYYINFRDSSVKPQNTVVEN
ncbi:MAG TPA: hypothetical protein PLD88_11320 [Candidatus Berkiella sp.]|nr:hypothetical protein [Candidatus Berkiella sp.]